MTVWVALSAPATVDIRIWDGLVHDASSSPLFSTKLPFLVPTANTGSTIRIGDQLHMAVVTFNPPRRMRFCPIVRIPTTSSSVRGREPSTI